MSRRATACVWQRHSADVVRALRAELCCRHGGAGEGQAKYPSVSGTLTESEFISKVRTGKNAMPAFGADFISDAQLSADFANLKSLAGQTGGIAAVSSGPSFWSHVQRMASQTNYWSKQRGTPAFPKSSGPFDNASRDWRAPILANQNQQSAGLQSAVSRDDTDLPATDVNRFKGNLIRTLLLLSRELLQAGTPLQADQNYDHCLSVICQTEEMYGYFNDLKKFADDPTRSAALAAQGLDMAFYNTDTRKLLDEVVALMKAAPKRD